MNFISYSSHILIILAALVGVLVVPSKAQDSPQDYVNAHNQARAQVGVGPMQWDEGIAAYARSYVDRLKGDCNSVHSGGPYGENLAGGGNSGDFSGVDAVNLWVNEKAEYNPVSNTCNRECRHYTQVVWRKSVRIGCAKVRCNNGGTIISCNYDPPGNYVGEKPY
ncbi:pathogenesis-related protein 1 [Capsella rubella]|nr:pathogenesis-related protein 1 [Capsella rubella]